MKSYSIFLLLIISLLTRVAVAQTEADSTQLQREYNNLDEALQNPERVYRLNLSNQRFSLADTLWSRFTNLQYLSLKDDHLQQLPLGIGALKNLKVLDLSGNDFKLLPDSYRNLSSLEELYLNDEKNFQFEKNIPILSGLPKLKTLHLENDGLKTLPKNIDQLSRLESLYLNKNRFKTLPTELKRLKSLQYLDIQDNRLSLPLQDLQDQNFGFKIRL